MENGANTDALTLDFVFNFRRSGSFSHKSFLDQVFSLTEMLVDQNRDCPNARRDDG
jgi:hypothetical protein